jgi:hypothetical protein
VVARATGLGRGGVEGALGGGRSTGNAEPGGASVAADGLAAQKKSLHSKDRDGEANGKRHEEFLAEIATIAPEKLIFLDEGAGDTSLNSCPDYFRFYLKSQPQSRSLSFA